MHIVNTTKGALPPDAPDHHIHQTPGDLVVLSAADTELALLAQAVQTLNHKPNWTLSVRLSKITDLHSKDIITAHLDHAARQAKLVVARILGGRAYWQSGLDYYAASLDTRGIAFAPLPGDGQFDQGLADLSTISTSDWATLWGYLVEGGLDNAVDFLRYAAWMIKHRQTDAPSLLRAAPPPPPARPLPKAGLYWPGAALCPIPLTTIQTHHWTNQAAVVALVFYKSLLTGGGGLDPIDALCAAIAKRGLNPLPVFVTSLKDPAAQNTLKTLFKTVPPMVIVNTTGFAVGTHALTTPDAAVKHPFILADQQSPPVLQTILASTSQTDWQQDTRGLRARDLAMHVALPEIDGRIITRAVSFKEKLYFDTTTECTIFGYRADAERCNWVADLVHNVVRLQSTPLAEKRCAFILANYPNRDGRLGNGVGLDTPQSVYNALQVLKNTGYSITNIPTSAQAMMRTIAENPTNSAKQRNTGGVFLPLTQYKDMYQTLPSALQAAVIRQWGTADTDPFVSVRTHAGQKTQGFVLAVHRFGHCVVAVQPARGYNIDAVQTYHDPELIPPHYYCAFYMWLRCVFCAHALVHFGKHGTLEWLPGKAVALSKACVPDAVLGAMPHFYPFIVNDPGEGVQAKRRTQATILDHMTPPMTRAETYDELEHIENLLDEYYEADGLDARRQHHIEHTLLDLCKASGLLADAGITDNEAKNAITTPHALNKIDTFLCEIKESQIRHGLHIFGQSPQGQNAIDLLQSLVRIPRGAGTGGDASFLRALAHDFALHATSETEFDPLDCDFTQKWLGARPMALANVSSAPWRHAGDTVERLELLATHIISTAMTDKTAARAMCPGANSQAVLDYAITHLVPVLVACGKQEQAALTTALNGGFIAPGPAGAPTRGRLDVLPTGRNFYGVDNRAVPTRTAWDLGWQSATALLQTHRDTYGVYPKHILLNAWGTSNMRTGGDDIAQCLALMGVTPEWDKSNRRVVGFDILPLSVLGRPRVDVTLRISGLFRDTFPQQIDLIDTAAQAVMRLDEPNDMNPAAAWYKEHKTDNAALRVFGAKPGCYGTGLQAMIDEQLWQTTQDLGQIYLDWGGYGYGAQTYGAPAHAAFRQRISATEAVVHNQDNREHDILDSDDYYQFQGGAAAAIHSVQGQHRPIYHNDHSRPERPRIRTLEQEIARVMRARVVNPKWIRAIKQHGYKGGAEIAATIDYLFAFAATTHAVHNHHFDLVYKAFLADNDTLQFLQDNNPAALVEIAERLHEALERGLWVSHSNSMRAHVRDLACALGKTQ